MGPIGMPELIILGIIVPMLALGIFIIILIVKKLDKSRNPIQPDNQQSTVEARLAKIEAFKSEGLITDTEYQEKRKQILDSM